RGAPPPHDICGRESAAPRGCVVFSRAIDEGSLRLPSRVYPTEGGARMKVRVTLAALAATLVALVATAAAGAQNQSGLVNVAVVNNTVQVPIGIAANVCGVSVDVLTQGILTGDTACRAVSGATATFAGGNGGGGGSQQGLINLFVANN